MAKKVSSEIVNSRSLRVLIVEDSEDDVLLIIRELKKGGYDPVYERVETEKAMSKALREKLWDVILCDYKLPKFNALSAIAVLKETNIDIPIIIVSGAIGEETAVECMRLGVQDYIMKDNLSRLCPAIARELEEAEVRNKHKLSEQALRESEEKYRIILEDMEEGYFELNLAGNFTFVNDAECRNMGYSREELIGMNNRQYTDKENAKKAFQAFSNLYKTEEPSRIFDYEVIKKDGSKIVSELLISLVKDSKGKPIGFRGLSRHITERKRVEETLRQSEEKYRLVVENAKEAIIIAQDVKLVFVNRAAVDMIGYSGEILVSKPFTDFIHPDDLNMVVDHHIRRLKGEEVPLSYSFRVIRQDGTVKLVEFNTAVIQWEERPATLSFLNDITERKQAEEKLRESEERYRTIIENIEDGYTELDLRGNFIFFNEALCRIQGYPKEELIKKNYCDLMDEENAQKIYEKYNKVYATGESEKEVQYEIITKSGLRRHLETSITPMKDAYGRIFAFRGIVRDRTESRQVEEVLRLSEEKYRTIIETIQDGYFETDLTGKFTFVNDAECNNLGYTREELIVMNNRQFSDEKTAKVLYHLLVEVYKTGIPVKAYAVELVKKDGTKAYNEISVSLIRNSKGEPIGFRGIARDVTERRQAEEVLRHSEEKYRTIIETIQDGYIETDNTGKLTFINDMIPKHLGYSREELIGKNSNVFQDEVNYKKTIQLFTEIYKTGKSVNAIELECIRKNGTKGIYELALSIIKDAKGKPIGFRSISRDITERKQAEEVLRQSEEKYRTIIETIQDGYFETDLTGKFTFVNDAECNNLGYTRKELIEMARAQYAGEKNRKLLINLFIEIYKTGIPVKAYNLEFTKKDGAKAYNEISVSLIRNSKGEPIGFRGIARDVTERKQAEEVLRQSEEKYRRLVENAQEGVYQSTVGYLSLNPALARMIGYDSPEEVMATITDIAQQIYVNPDDGKKLLELVNEKDSVTDFETEYYKKDGSRIWVSINMHAVRDDQGRILYYQGINQDITEKKKIEVERRENIERLRKAMGATINAMAVTVETRDPYTAGHQRRVADLARAIATEMNLTSNQIDGVRMASTIHDIGKISIPSEILTKPTKLTDLEFSIIKTHSQSGYDILKDIEFPWPVADVVLQHHERMDGSGYPGGLKGNDILLEARIIAVADVVEAIASHRPYRPALGNDLALEEISRNKGILYDADAVDACLKLFREKGYTLVVKA